MRTRLLFAGKTAEGRVVIDCVTCPCCDGDVFEWIDSLQQEHPNGTAGLPLGLFRCVSCGEETWFDETRYLLEAADEKDAWFARRHAESTIDLDHAAKFVPEIKGRNQYKREV